jgi:hypothetical protein
MRTSQPDGKLVAALSNLARYNPRWTVNLNVDPPGGRVSHLSPEIDKYVGRCDHGISAMIECQLLKEWQRKTGWFGKDTLVLTRKYSVLITQRDREAELCLYSATFVDNDIHRFLCHYVNDPGSCDLIGEFTDNLREQHRKEGTRKAQEDALVRQTREQKDKLEREKLECRAQGDFFRE